MIESVVLKGGTAFSRVSRNYKRKQNMKPYWNSVKSIVWKNTAKRFRDGGGSAGKWASLSPATTMLRKKGGDKPLQDNGLLMKSVTTKQSVMKETTKELIIGSNKKYAMAMQKGFSQRITPKMRGFFVGHELFRARVGSTITVPAREFLYLDAQDKKEMGQALKFHFAGITRGAR